MAICTNCGKELADGIRFCTECGTKVGMPIEDVQPDIAPVQETTAQAEINVQQTIPTQQSVPVQQSFPQAEPAAEVVGTGTFFGLSLLFKIPLIGWLICIIMSFTSKNKNVKNYARSVLIWMIIGLIFSVIAYFILKWIFDMVIGFVSGITDEFFSDSGNIINIISEISELGEIDGLGEISGIEDIGEISGDINAEDFIAQFGDISEVLSGLENLPVE